ncbi:hypothetical protein Ptr902_09887 [Pyrenophora tritici-repentis]|nr:hypothetical protein Ptr902_09887 [Pyrenophora tritici-repentis]
MLWDYERLSDDWKDALKAAVRLEGTAWIFRKPLYKEESEHAFHPIIVNFESGIYTSQRKVQLDRILNDDAYYRKEMGSDHELKWLHLPANNMKWVELLMLQYGLRCKTLDRDQILTEQLWRERLHSGIGNFPHARYMKLLCRQIGKTNKTDSHKVENSYVFMMPYIHWEFADTFSSMTIEGNNQIKQI